MEKIQPFNSFLLIKPEQPQTKTASGIVIPQIAAELSNLKDRGHIKAVGDKCEKAKVGQYVIFKKYAPDELEVDGETYYMIEERDVLCAIKEE